MQIIEVFWKISSRGAGGGGPGENLDITLPKVYEGIEELNNGVAEDVP